MGPSFWILDGCAVTGRNGLYAIASTPGAAWWRTDAGILYSGRHGDWDHIALDAAAVAVQYRHASDVADSAWLVLTADGGFIEISDETQHQQIATHGPLRCMRIIGNHAVIVGAHGQVFRRNRDGMITPLPGLLNFEAHRFLVHVAGNTHDDFTVVGQGGEVFHWNGNSWDNWSIVGADLFVVVQDHRATLVAGDGGKLWMRQGNSWRRIPIATTEPIVGLCWHNETLWAATPTTLFVGNTNGLQQTTGPGFGGQLAVGDDVLHCFGAAHVSRRIDQSWQPLHHPAQLYVGAPPEWPTRESTLALAMMDNVDPATELGGKLFAKDDITAKDLKRWAKLSQTPKQVAAMLADPGNYRVLEIEGDLHVRGDLRTLDRKLVGLVVHGNLIVDGTFRDCDHPQTITLVGGKMTATTIITAGELEVGGGLTCTHLLGDYNDYSAVLRGGVTARLFWPENHSFAFERSPTFELCVGNACKHRVNAVAKRSVLPTDGRVLAVAIDPEFVQAFVDEDRKHVIAALLAGKSVLRHPTRGMAKKPAAKKPVAKKPAAKKPVAKKPAAKKPAAKKPAAKKPVAKKPVAKKPVAKMPAAKKPVAKKPVAKTALSARVSRKR